MNICEITFDFLDFQAYFVGDTGQTSIHESTDPDLSFDDHREIFIEMFKKFLPLAMKYLKLKSLPKMIFEPHVSDTHQPTFGRYNNGKKTLEVALMNRHPNDILRTIAHELTHFKQDTLDELDHDSGETGSPEENQANQTAGIIMRHFNKKYPEYLSAKPITQ